MNALRLTDHERRLIDADSDFDSVVEIRVAMNQAAFDKGAELGVPSRVIARALGWQLPTADEHDEQPVRLPGRPLPKGLRKGKRVA